MRMRRALLFPSCISRFIMPESVNVRQLVAFRNLHVLTDGMRAGLCRLRPSGLRIVPGLQDFIRLPVVDFRLFYCTHILQAQFQ